MDLTCGKKSYPCVHLELRNFSLSYPPTPAENLEIRLSHTCHFISTPFWGPLFLNGGFVVSKYFQMCN